MEISGHDSSNMDGTRCRKALPSWMLRRALLVASRFAKQMKTWNHFPANPTDPPVIGLSVGGLKRLAVEIGVNLWQ